MTWRQVLSWMKWNKGWSNECENSSKKSYLLREGSHPRCWFFWMQEMFNFHSQVSSSSGEDAHMPKLQSSMVLRERVSMAWKISQPKATEMFEGQSAVNCLPGTSRDSERTELRAKTCILYFLEEEKMSYPHFEFRYFLECQFNLILFKQLLNPLNKWNLN